MDIARYIGLFLLKNQFCYIHGLGNLELKKVPAAHDSKSLSAPAYNVILSPKGSIDDNLANFIATNEQISISKAANALRDFSIQARKEIEEGKEVHIPNIGKFVEERGKIGFITDANFQYTPAALPVIKNSRQLEEQQAMPSFRSTSPVSSGSNINWSMIILIVVLLLILGGGGYGLYHYLQHNKSDKTTITEATTSPAVTEPATAVADTTSANRSETTEAAEPAPAVDSNTLYAIKWVIGSYHTRARADRRVETLGLSHIPAEVVSQDSTHHLVITTVNSRTVDTAHIRDSLTRFYGFREVTIFQ